MDITCSNCQNRCCSCMGCQPTNINGKWFCPRCAGPQTQFTQQVTGQQGEVQMQNITGTGNNSVQMITNRKL